MLAQDSPTRRTPKQRRQRFTKERPPEESVETPWRLFIAVPVPEDVREFIGEIIADLKREDWPVRWTDADNAHLTLHFLGDTPPENAEILRMALAEPVSRHEAFDLRTADLGVFPAMKHPRVLWLGLWGPAHRLESIRDDIGTVLEEFDYELDDKPFRPHLTLGRVRDTRNVRVRDLPGAIRATFDAMADSGNVTHDKPLPFPVREVHLVRSHLSHEGASYEIIERYPMKAPTE
ncbi:MAG TPA: RNA 2',3'-cyclic phosphodiesterase [Thermomicrobiales bacterium]|nr:RNA 2',3'-cyclic phosphodiesterase [Thermomicrobiales bacterium]